MKTLIVVDMQNDFVTGPLGTKKHRRLCQKLKIKLVIMLYEKIMLFLQETHMKKLF